MSMASSTSLPDNGLLSNTFTGHNVHIPGSGSARRIPAQLLRMHERLCAANLVPPLQPYATLQDVEDGIFDGVPDEADPTSSSPSMRTSTSAGKTCGSKSKRPVLVSGSLDNTLKFWDVRTGRCFHTLFGHVEGVWCVDADTLRIVSASHDRTVKIWDRDTAQCQITLVGHRRAVTTVALGDDKILSGSDDGDVRVWSFCPPDDGASMTSSSGTSANRVSPASTTSSNTSSALHPPYATTAMTSRPTSVHS